MRRQRLLDALTNPMQRLTRYSLLLKAVLKHTVDDAERDAIQVPSVIFSSMKSLLIKLIYLLSAAFIFMLQFHSLDIIVNSSEQMAFIITF